MPDKKNQNALRREGLARSIYEVLEELKIINGRPRTGQAHKIVNIILNSIVEALRRGESIKIDGLGTFTTHTLPARTRKITYIEWNKGKWNHERSPTVKVQVPSKQVVKFIPSKTILRELTNDNSNTPS